MGVSQNEGPPGIRGCRYGDSMLYLFLCACDEKPCHIVYVADHFTGLCRVIISHYQDYSYSSRILTYHESQGF